MIAGDSITQGHHGDWTWRYRMWQWFKQESIDVDFVGPYIGTQPYGTIPENATIPPVEGEENPPPAWGEYAVGVAADFDRNHFSAWGRQAAQTKLLIAYQMKKFMPDYLLVLLGFNDLGWWASDVDGLLESIKTIVDKARAENPNIKIAVGDVRNSLPLPSFILSMRANQAFVLARLVLL